MSTASYPERVLTPTPQDRRTVSAEEIPAWALEVFRKVEALSARTGYACFKLLETFAAMCGRSVRAVRYALAELIRAGWIERQHVRKPRPLLFLAPLVRVAKTRATRFFASPIAGKIAGKSGPKLQDATPSPYRKLPEGVKDDEQDADAKSVVVSSPPATDAAAPTAAPAPSPELVAAAVAVGVPARQAARLVAGHAAGVVRQAIAAVASVTNPRKPTALLTTALRERWDPPAPKSEHPSDAGNSTDRPVRYVQAPRGFALSANVQTDAHKPESGAMGGKADWEAMKARLRGETAPQATIEAREGART